MRTMTQTKTLLLELLALLALAALLGAAMNVVRPQPLPWLGSGMPAQEAAPSAQDVAPGGVHEIPVIGTAAAMGLVASGGALFVDARYVEDFASGHLPGAVSVPPGVFEDEIAALLGPVPGDRPLVLYCSSLSCPMSHELALGLEYMGYTDIYVYAEGFAGWVAADGAVEVAQ